MNRALLAIVLVAGSGAALWLSNSSKDRAPPAHVASPSPRSVEKAGEVDELRQELGMLRRDVAVMRADQASPAATEKEGPAAAQVVEQPKLPSPEEREARDRERNEKTGILMSSQMKAEPRDPAWSTQTERQVADALRTVEISGTRFASATCHTTMCAITLTHDDIESQRKASHEIFRHLGFLSQGFFTYGMDGSTPTTTAYFARAGQELPRLDASQ